MVKSTALQIVVATELKRQGMTWQAMAERIGVAAPTIHIRVGQDIPTTDTIQVVADALNLHFDDICAAMLREVRLAEHAERIAVSLIVPHVAVRHGLTRRLRR